MFEYLSTHASALDLAERQRRPKCCTDPHIRTYPTPVDVRRRHASWYIREPNAVKTHRGRVAPRVGSSLEFLSRLLHLSLPLNLQRPLPPLVKNLRPQALPLRQARPPSFVFWLGYNADLCFAVA